MEPVAIVKARSLDAHLHSVPGRHLTCAVTLTDREAWELLSWFNLVQGYGTDPSFTADYNRALALNDPWPVLSEFTLMDYPFERLPGESH
jgi:hypothetical protein